MTTNEERVNGILRIESDAGYDGVIIKEHNSIQTVYKIYMPCHNWQGEMIGPTVFGTHNSAQRAWEEVMRFELHVRFAVVSIVEDDDGTEPTVTTEFLNDR